MDGTTEDEEEKSGPDKDRFDEDGDLIVTRRQEKMMTEVITIGTIVFKHSSQLLLHQICIFAIIFDLCLVRNITIFDMYNAEFDLGRTQKNLS